MQDQFTTEMQHKNPRHLYIKFHDNISSNLSSVSLSLSLSPTLRISQYVLEPLVILSDKFAENTS